MSKRDELKFAVKKSLIVGTATATLGAMSCQPSGDGPDVISNPVPDRGVDTGRADVADATDDPADAGDAGDGESASDATPDTADAEEDGESGADDGGSDGSS